MLKILLKYQWKILKLIFFKKNKLLKKTKCLIQNNLKYYHSLVHKMIYKNY